MEVIAKRIKTTEGVEGFLSRPQAAARGPAVLVSFELFGLNGHIEDICRRLAAEGYVALAPDYYFRLPKRTVSYDDVKAGFGMALTLTDTQVLADVESCLGYLRQQPFVEGAVFGALGFCMGGRIAVLTAAAYPKEIGAVVSCDGGGLSGENRREGQTLNALDEVAKVRAPLLLFYGELDQHIT